MATVRKRKISVVSSAFTTCILAAGYTAMPAVAGEWTITPSAELSETMTDNVALSSDQKKSDLITDASVGIQINGSGNRAKLDVSYQVHNLFYAQDSSRNKTQNHLNASGTLEAIEGWFFIEAGGSIAQQNISPFLGVTSTSVNTNADSNTSETSTYRLSPYFQGTLGAVADYVLRYDLATTKTRANSAYNSDTRALSLSVKGITDSAALGWKIDADTQTVEYGNDLSNQSDSLRGTLTYPFSPQFSVSVIGGIEANDYLSAEKESALVKGIGFDWSPTERTTLSASAENGLLGNSYDIDVTHRTAGTVWKYTESKETTVLSNQESTLGLGTYYDLLFSLYSSAIPDSVARAAYVNALLLSNGISPNAQMQGGYLSSGVARQHIRALSFALTGVRNTVTLSATQSKTNNISNVSGSGLLIGNDLSTFQVIRQRGISLNWSHKLTPFSTLVGMVSHLESKGSGTTSTETTQKTFNLNYLIKLSPQTSASIGVRRVIANYSENAITATLSHRF